MECERRRYVIVMFCTVLYCIVLYCTARDTQQEENGGTEQVTDRDSIVRGSFTIAWETSSDNAVYVLG